MLPRPVTVTSEAMHAFAHDVRSYIRTALTRAQLVDRSSGEALDEKARAHLKDAIDAISGVDKLVEAFVRYSEALDPLSAERRTAPLKLVVQGAAIAMKPRFTNAGGSLIVDSEIPELPTLAALRTVLIELLDNSLKFRGVDPPQAAIHYRRNNGRFAILVVDNGIGFEPGQCIEIFQPFKRLHSKHMYPGNGLGLAISKSLIEQGGGEISAESKAGAGATFICSLPAHNPRDF